MPSVRPGSIQAQHSAKSARPYTAALFPRARPQVPTPDAVPFAEGIPARSTAAALPLAPLDPPTVSTADVSLKLMAPLVNSLDAQTKSLEATVKNTQGQLKYVELAHSPN